jgi:hypothetical protein
MKLLITLLLLTGSAWAGLPPTTSKDSTDVNNITTFFYRFPNFTGTHTGVTFSLGVDSVAGGGTGLATSTPYALFAGGTIAAGPLQQVSGLGTSGQILTSNGPGALPTWQSGAGSGTVTSVGFADASTTPIYTITNTPVTTSGTLTETLHTQGAGLAFLGPITGAAAQPSFRNLVTSDVVPTAPGPYEIVVGGTAAGSQLQQVSSVGASAGQVLTFQGASSLPTWTAQSIIGTIVASYYMSVDETVTPTAQFNFDTKVYDSNNAVTTGTAGSAGTWKFTAPTTGIYLVTGWVPTAFGGGNFTSIYKNGSDYATVNFNGGYVSTGQTFSYQISLNSGDYFDIRTTAPSTTAYGGAQNGQTGDGVCSIGVSLVTGTSGGGFLPLSSGNLSAISANEIVGSGQTARGITVQNLTATATSFTCGTNPVFSLCDCGTSGSGCTGACPTTIGTVTVTSANTPTAGTVTTPIIAAGHFWAWEITSGTCTVLDANGSAGL